LRGPATTPCGRRCSNRPSCTSAKSGAGIVAKLFELAGGSTGQDGVCLRPELTAGIVRAYTAAETPPELPWRVSHSGPVFRYEKPRPGRLREFQQVGVERLGDSGPLADAEVIWLADWALAEAGVTGATIRLGHVGLILEMLQRSGLPAPAGLGAHRDAERGGRRGRGGQGARTRPGTALRLAPAWRAGRHDRPAVDRADDGGIDRLFRTLVPVVTGRRSGHEIVHRLRRKWDLGHGLLSALERVRRQVHELADLKGEPTAVLDRLGRDGESLAPDSVASPPGPAQGARRDGVEPSRVVLDLGFGRGSGFILRSSSRSSPRPPTALSRSAAAAVTTAWRASSAATATTAGVGFAFGLERLAGVLDAQGRAPSPAPPGGFVVLAGSPESLSHANRWAVRLRLAGARALLETDRSPAEALAKAGSARVVVVSGPDSLVLHDPAGKAPSPCSPAQLERLAREERPR